MPVKESVLRDTANAPTYATTGITYTMPDGCNVGISGPPFLSRRDPKVLVTMKADGFLVFDRVSSLGDLKIPRPGGVVQWRKSCVFEVENNSSEAVDFVVEAMTYHEDRKEDGCP